MTRAEALKILEESLARPSSTPTLGAEDRVAYLDAEKEKLRSCLIDPIEVTATASAFEWAKEAFGRNGEIHRMIGIARSGEWWLLYDPATSLFAHAFEAKGFPDHLL